MKKNNLFTTIIKGFVVGGSMDIPGCSGGTMAIILGIYDQVIHSISTFRKDIKKNSLILFPFLLGSILGIFLLSKPLEYLLEAFPQPTRFFFLGAIIGSLPALYKKTTIKKIDWKTVIFLALGFGIVFLLNLIPKDSLINVESTSSLKGYLMLIFSGIIIAVAMVLPGISTSHMLLLLGMYETVIGALNNLNLAYLFPLAFSILVGTLLTTSFLEKMMNRHPGPTYLLIIGFVIGSVVQIFEGTGFPSGLNILYSVLTLAAGFFAILTVSKYSQ